MKEVPQGSVLDRLLFILLTGFIFFGTTEAINYAADTNLYVYRIDLSNLNRRLEHDSLITMHGLNAI